MDGEHGGERLVVQGRAEIDTRAPFKSVKEAVTLFGERILVGEIYAKKMKERVDVGESQTKQNEENNLLAFCLQSLKDELERTKQELKQLKSTEHEKLHHEHPLSPIMAIHHDVDKDPKFVQNKKENNTNMLQKKRSVKFAVPLELNRNISVKYESMAQKSSLSPPSTKKPKKKTLAYLIGRFFTKKKKNHQ
ncbi:WEB family protein At3g51220-like [Cucurbita moschata]|uniref:WEB family protein At3g51220-like n=1 Tax=Cucurbita moschata TaxID=3662 RepID=A0A6J1EL94_CUCMO|nr:WEB family protein At3g51220-like [Cucurbita moschata]